MGEVFKVFDECELIENMMVIFFFDNGLYMYCYGFECEVDYVFDFII